MTDQTERRNTRLAVERKEYEGGVLVFDLDCPDCNYVRHRCPGCGDDQRHDGRSVFDGHTAWDHLDDSTPDQPPGDGPRPWTEVMGDSLTTGHQPTEDAS